MIPRIILWVVAIAGWAFMLYVAVAIVVGLFGGSMP